MKRPCRTCKILVHIQSQSLDCRVCRNRAKRNTQRELGRFIGEAITSALRRDVQTELEVEA